jgi:hypothetical protein
MYEARIGRLAADYKDLKRSSDYAFVRDAQSQ